jgi:hypothetical protein
MVIGFDLGLLFLRFLFFETDRVVTWFGLLGTMWRCQVKYYCIIIVGDGIPIHRQNDMTMGWDLESVIG